MDEKYPSVVSSCLKSIQFCINEVLGSMPSKQAISLPGRSVGHAGGLASILLGNKFMTCKKERNPRLLYHLGL
jgi:hypothetical protein